MVDNLSQQGVFSVGHSTHSYKNFLELIRSAGVTAIADVRTSPFSRHFPHFTQDSFKSQLQADGIAYSFLGKHLGGRPTSSQYYCDGIADYERMAQSPDFALGLKRVLDGAQKYRIALMCSEHDPLDCHRCLLVSRALVKLGESVEHILSDGMQLSHREIEERLLKLEGQSDDDLFRSMDERISEAYRRRARKIAYSIQADDSKSPPAAD